MRIQQASAKDAETVAMMAGELLQEIMVAIGSAVFTFDPVKTEARLRSWLPDHTYHVFLALEDHHATGFLALYECYALYADGVFGTIPELYVRPAYRSRGIGAMLLAEAKAYARARGWTRLEVTTPPLPQFERTLAFYERHGFTITGGRKLKVELS